VFGLSNLLMCLLYQGRPKGNTLSNVKPNEAAKRKTKQRDACYKKTEELEQQQLEVLVDGEPLNQNQEVSADDDMLAKNTFVEPISAVNLVPTTADPYHVPSYVSLHIFNLIQFLVT
jgi:hypothetical protein